MFAYCQGNPVKFQDDTGTRMVPADPLRGGPVGAATSSGLSPTYSPGPSGSLGKSIVKFLTNEDEQTVLETKHLAFYKGVLVVRTNGDRSGFFGAMFLTRETNDRSNPEDMVRHEYGHAVQMQKLGVVKYTTNILIPSWLEWGSNSNYYSREVEITADVFGGVTSRSHTAEDISAGFKYLERSTEFGILAWTTIK